MSKPFFLKKLFPLFDNNYLWLLLAAFVVYWPITLGIFSAKNDNIMVFLAFRYNISEIIHAGHFPLWTPYIQLGFPLHADMQSSAWNPIVYVLSLFGRYNLTVLHAEIFIYILLSGIGMYKLLLHFQVQKKNAFSFAFCYMLCGFITDTGGNNILFLAGCSFIPFALLYAYRMLTFCKVRDAVKTSLSLFFLLTAAYPFFFVVTVYIVFAGFAIKAISALLNRHAYTLLTVIKVCAISAVCFILLSLPALLSFYSLLPHYSRGENISLVKAQENNFQLHNISSVLFPQASTKLQGANDITMRNMYFGLFPLLFFILFFFTRPVKKIHWFIISGIIFFFLFSLGSDCFIREWAYHLLPLMDRFRHAANARIFVITGSIILGALAWERCLKNEAYLKLAKLIALFILIITILIALLNINAAAISQQLQHLNLTLQNISRASLKKLSDALSFKTLLLLAAGIQSVFLLLFLSIKKRSLQLQTSSLMLLNAFIFCQLSFPFTFISKQSPAGINHLIKNYPAGLPFPHITQAVSGTLLTDSNKFSIIGLENYYNKKIGINTERYNPTVLHAIDSILRNKNTFNAISQLPLAYIADTVLPANMINLLSSRKITDALFSDDKRIQLKQTSVAEIRLAGFTNNSFSFDIFTDNAAAVCLQQAYLPGWSASMDGYKTTIQKGNIAFMFVQIPKGRHKLIMKYEPWLIFPSFIISLISFLLLTILIFKNKLK